MSKGKKEVKEKNLQICNSLPEMQKCQNGEVAYIGKDTLSNDDFNKEKDLAEFVKNNIELFVDVLLNDKLVKYEFEKPIRQRYSLSPRVRSVDLYIECELKTYIIEFKNPKYESENRQAIGQILDYGREFNNNSELIIITTKFDINTAQTINHYRLPIKYVYMSKNQFFEYKDIYKNA